MKNNNMLERAKEIHRVYHKFYNWLIKKYGMDLYGDWIINTIQLQDGKTKKLKYRNFNENEFNKRLVGNEVIEDIERYVKRYCKEIKIVHCDDSYHSGSILLLIPHITHGVTVMFIPQCTTIQNNFFLYHGHYKMLMKELKNMENVYNKKGDN